MGEGSKIDSTPPPDLMRERDEVLSSFSRGARLTEQFMAEYARMRERALELEEENDKLRAQIEADDALARLLQKVEALEEERKDLLTRTEKAEREQDKFGERFNEVEHEFAALANLFVASNQLHISLTPRGVVRRIKEILAQLVGAECYAMFMVTSDGSQLVPVASEGVPGDKLEPLPMEGSSVGRVVEGGEAEIDDERVAKEPDYRNPPVIVPLKVDDRSVGAVVIYGTLEQKGSFTSQDFELFKLLGHHAAAALVGAALFEQAGRRLPGAELFRDVSV